MIFNSLRFLIFFILFFALYWAFSKRPKLQNILLLIGSCTFYAWADWRPALLLYGISAAIFLLAIRMEKTTSSRGRSALFYLGLFLSLGVLVFFKYFNFFIDSFNDLFRWAGLHSHLQTLSILVPLGISFFTFRILSYLFDVNNGKIEPTTNWIVFFNFVSFFPSLLSGPIDKAKMFIPQLEAKRTFNYYESVDGMRQILWGLFKKMVIADRCAEYSSAIFGNQASYPGSALALGAIAFTFQIYADFSGYSDMAIGISRLLGFSITKNFDFPFFAENIAEFWRKWNISLTSWLTEYLFTPLSIRFRDWGKTGLVLAILITFTVIGMWHGANWTYVLFGFVHGCYFIPLILNGTMSKRKKAIKDRMLPSVAQGLHMMLTFGLVTLAFILFKSNTLSEAFRYYKRLFSFSLFKMPQIPVSLFLLLLLFMAIEWAGRNYAYGIEHLWVRRGKVVRWALYLGILVTIFLYQGKPAAFIYFQF